MPTPKALHPNWRRSRRFLLGYATAQVAAWVAVMGSALPMWAQALSALLLLWHAQRLRSRCRPLLTTSQLRDLWWDGERWCGEWPGGPQPLVWRGAVVRPWLVVLHFGPSLGRGVAVAIVPDQLPGQQFRALRQIAQHGALAAGQD